jgi:hypothetical protein
MYFGVHVPIGMDNNVQSTYGIVANFQLSKISIHNIIITCWAEMNPFRLVIFPFSFLLSLYPSCLRLSALGPGPHPVKQHAGAFNVKITRTAVRRYVATSGISSIFSFVLYACSEASEQRAREREESACSVGPTISTN